MSVIEQESPFPPRPEEAAVPTSEPSRQRPQRGDYAGEPEYRHAYKIWFAETQAWKKTLEERVANLEHLLAPQDMSFEERVWERCDQQLAKIYPYRRALLITTSAARVGSGADDHFELQIMNEFIDGCIRHAEALIEQGEAVADINEGWPDRS